VTRVLQRLTTDAELVQYVERYAEASGYRVPLDYLRRAVVLGLVRDGRLLGGVVMSRVAPFRTLQRIPESDRAAVTARVDLADTVELACVWLDRDIRSGALSALFWFGLFLESGRRGARTVMFGTESPRLRDLYLCGRPTTVYAGPVVVDGVERAGWVFLSPVRHRWPALIRMTVYKALRDVSRRRTLVARPAEEAS
jgi:hypothetical protein